MGIARNGDVVVLNTGGSFGHNTASSLGFRFGIQTDPVLSNARLYAMGAIEIPRYTYQTASLRDRGYFGATNQEEAEVEAINDAIDDEIVEHCSGAVNILDLIDSDDGISTLVGHAFIDCDIIGPVVLVNVENSISISNCKIDPSQFWTIEPARGYFGGVAIVNCSFQGCKFSNVGFAGAADWVEMALESLMSR